MPILKPLLDSKQFQYHTSVYVPSFADISLFGLPTLAEDQWLLRNPPRLQNQIRTFEESRLMDQAASVFLTSQCRQSLLDCQACIIVNLRCRVSDM